MEMINAIGRRKASVARIYLTQGEGKITVNGKDYKEYFTIPHIQSDITDPFDTVEIDGNIYDVKVNVNGGGFKGQAQAIRMAISRALVKMNEEPVDFDVENAYVLDITGTVKFDSIPPESLYELYKDGRVFGPLAEELTAKRFKKMVKSPELNGFWDVQHTTWGHTYEVRTLTKGGANLIPSNQIGAGRKYNEEEYLEKLNNIYGFILFDIRNIPEIRIISMKTTENGGINNFLKNNKGEVLRRITPRLFDELFDLYKD